MDKELQIMLPMKISNWESIPYSEGLNCPNPECTNKSYDDEARSILGWCETPYGFMQVCECKKCFAKYRMHGFEENSFIDEGFIPDQTKAECARKSMALDGYNAAMESIQKIIEHVKSEAVDKEKVGTWKPDKPKRIIGQTTRI